MKKLMVLLLAASLFLFIGGVAIAVPVTNVAEFPTGYFTPDESSYSTAPYYRWYNEDWGWEHSAILGTYTSAELLISAFDVDSSSGEVDIISAYSIDDDALVELGSLVGTNAAWEYTTFALDMAEWGNEIAAGLQIFMNIDSTHTQMTWAVALGKSVLSLDGGTVPDPTPGVPEPATMLFLGTGLIGLAAIRKKILK